MISLFSIFSIFLRNFLIFVVLQNAYDLYYPQNIFASLISRKLFSAKLISPANNYFFNQDFSKRFASSSRHNTEKTQVFFSPEDNIKNLLLSYLRKDNKKIFMSIFTLTCPDVTQALISAYKNNTEVEIVTDHSQFETKYSKCKLLSEAGIPVWLNKRNQLLHHKFVILYGPKINQSTLWTGSANFSKYGLTNNRENVLIIKELNIIRKYQNAFDKLKQEGSRLD